MNKERLVKTFTDLVALDSPSFDEQAVCRYIQERLTALGVQVAEDDSAAATQAGGHGRERSHYLLW